MLIKEPGFQIRSKLIEKFAKVLENVHAPYYIMATPEEKQIDMHFENGMINVFLRKSSGIYFSGDEL